MPDPSRSVHDAVPPAHAPDGHSPRSVDDPATTFTRWEQGAWVLAASFHLVGSGPLFGDGLARIARSLRPGGRAIVAAGRLDGDPVSVEVTRWQTLRASGRPWVRADIERRFAAAGLGESMVLPTPPQAPAMYASRRPTITSLR